MTRPLKIAIVCYPGLGGSGVIASELARGLASLGHRVFVVATAMPERLRVNGVRFERVDVPSSPVFEHGPYTDAVASHLVHLVRREAIDVVHLHYAIPHASSALLAALVLGAAAPTMVLTLHGTDVTRLGSNPSVQPVTSFAIGACDGITAPSQFLRGAATACFGVPADRIQVISNFVDVDRFKPPPRRDPQQFASLFPTSEPGPTLFHVSNFRPIKNTPDLAVVLATVRRSIPARMVLVGDGPDRAAAEQRAAALGLGDAMRFLGRRDDFEGLLGHADGFVLPSQSESFGVAALEAMAAGVPVFAYRVGGLPEVVADQCGTLVPVGDLDALAGAVVAGIGERDAMGAAGRARAEAHFRSDRVIATYETYYRRVRAGRAKEV